MYTLQMIGFMLFSQLKPIFLRRYYRCIYYRLSDERREMLVFSAMLGDSWEILTSRLRGINLVLFYRHEVRRFGKFH